MSKATLTHVDISNLGRIAVPVLRRRVLDGHGRDGYVPKLFYVGFLLGMMECTIQVCRPLYVINIRVIPQDKLRGSGPMRFGTKIRRDQRLKAVNPSLNRNFFI